MRTPPTREFHDQDFRLWLAEAVEHMHHLPVSLRLLLIVQIIVVVLLWFFR